MKNLTKVLYIILPLALFFCMGCNSSVKNEDNPIDDNQDVAVDMEEAEVDNSEIEIVEESPKKVEQAMYADTASFAKSLKTPISSGSYNPIWTSTLGFRDSPDNCNCAFSRIGKVVTVICDLGVPRFEMGTNRATLSLPEGLPLSRNHYISGTFSSDHYRNSKDPNVGIVSSRGELTKVEVQVNNSPSGSASSWCNFTYMTDAE